jgi:hypothetical protein
MGASATYTTTIAGLGNNAGIPVPEEILEELGAGKRPGLIVNANGYEYRTSVGVMKGQFLLSLSAAHRKASGLAPGDEVAVTLTVADAPREVNVPEDLAAAMEAAGVRVFFDGLSNCLQRYHIDLITGAKAEDTRARRVEKAVGLFAEGKQR